MKRSKRWGLSVPLLLLLLAGGDRASSQWLLQHSGTNAKLTDVVVLDSLTALCVGDSGKILKTTNAGLTWISKYSGGQQWNGIAFLNLNNGIVVGNRMAVAVTSDGGDTWSPWAQAGPPNLLTVACVGMASIFIGSDSGHLFYSHNGSNWFTYRLGSEPINSIFGARGDFLPVDMYAVLPRTAYKSTDLGATWTPQSLPITTWGSALRGAIAPSRTAFIVGVDGNPGPFPVILRRTLLDTAWVKFVSMPPVLPRVVRDVAAPTNQLAYACGSLGVMFKTIDGGGFWGMINSGTQRNLNAIHFPNERRGFAVGDSGTILFTANGGITSVADPSSVLMELALYQNFPNLFNPSTTIEYCLPVRASVEIKVLDVLGREVATLLNEEKPAGVYSVRWNADGRASGVY